MVVVSFGSISQLWSDRNRFSRGTPLINMVGHFGPFVASQHHLFSARNAGCARKSPT